MLILAAGFAAVSLGIGGGAQAQGLLVGAIATGITGKALLDKADGILRGSLNRVEYGTNALAGRLASEAGVLARMIDLSLGSHLDRAVRELDEQTGLAFYRLAQVMDEFQAAQDRAYAARDATVVDLAMLASTAPFFDRLTFIERISGLVQFDDGQDFAVSVVATGLKPGMADTTADVALDLGGRRIVPVRVERGGDNQACIVVRRDDFLGHFKPDAINVVPGEVRLTVRRSPWYSLGGYFDEVSEVKAPVYVSFFPKVVGTLTVTARVRQFAWMALPAPDGGDWHVGAAVTAADCGEAKCNGNEPVYHLTMSVAGGDKAEPGSVRIKEIRKGCTPLWGPNACAGWHQVTSQGITDGASRAHMDVRHWAEMNEYRLEARLERYEEVQSVDRSQSVVLRYDANLEFLVPKDTTYWRISGKTVTGKPVDVVRNQQSDQMRFVSEFEEGQGQRRVVYSVDRQGIGM